MPLPKERNNAAQSVLLSATGRHVRDLECLLFGRLMTVAKDAMIVVIVSGKRISICRNC
jgi:hypothetical protein